MTMVCLARFSAEETRCTIDGIHRKITDSRSLLERRSTSHQILHSPSVGGVRPMTADSPKTWCCLVKIKYANILDLRIVDCVKRGQGIYLQIPVADYDRDAADLRPEWTLRIPADWLAEYGAPEYDLLCRRVIDLDERDELPWEKLPPPAGK